MATIAENLALLSTHLEDAYTALEAKGATIPETHNATNLSACIDSVTTTKYGANIGGFLGDVNSDGVLQQPSEDTHLVFDGVYDLAPYALYCRFWNTPIKSISFPDLSVITGDRGLQSAFRSSSNLTSVTFPCLTTIEPTTALNYAFSECTHLLSVYFKAVSRVCTTQFAGCTSLSVVNFGNELTAVPTLHGTNAFTSVPSTCKVVVPDALYDDWIAASNWSALSVTYVKYSEFEG